MSTPPRRPGPVDPVGHSQDAWREGRRRLNRTRGSLARSAALLYDPSLRLDGTPLLAPPEWVPAEPCPLEHVALEWTDDPEVPAVAGDEPEAAGVLPLCAPAHRFSRYTSAMRHLDPPALFEDRPSYRLLGLDVSASSVRMRFGPGSYFEKLDLGEGVAHELAVAAGTDAHRSPSWSELPLRTLVGDPFDLRRRSVIPAIETLTLRRDRSTGAATFVLQWRDPGKVATTAGIHGLVPAGEFQPTNGATSDRVNDFDLWRNIVREYAEEMLGEPERVGPSARPFDYESWGLFQVLREARGAGRLSVHFLGVGLDALTLTATVLTVAVFDDDLFDEVFGRAVRGNAEGQLVTPGSAVGFPFTPETVHRLVREEPMASPAAAVLTSALHHRAAVLSH